TNSSYEVDYFDVADQFTCSENNGEGKFAIVRVTDERRGLFEVAFKAQLYRYVGTMIWIDLPMLIYLLWTNTRNFIIISSTDILLLINKSKVLTITFNTDQVIRIRSTRDNQGMMISMQSA
ncbi:hypothetical protein METBISCDRAFT_24982, partial [Metschnikowia bicuspidata]